MMEEEIALATILIGVGITAVLYVFRLSEYFENEVNNARDRLKDLEKYKCAQAKNDSLSKAIDDAIDAQKIVYKWYAGRNQRFTFVWIPAFILFLVLSGFLLELSPNSAFPWCFYVILWILTIGASICVVVKQELEEREKSKSVLIPIGVLLGLLVILFGFYFRFPDSPLLTLCVFYFIALLIPSVGAGIGMLGRPIAKYHEVIWKLEELD